MYKKELLALTHILIENMYLIGKLCQTFMRNYAHVRLCTGEYRSLNKMFNWAHSSSNNQFIWS